MTEDNKQQQDTQSDVVIIGAGLAGLCTARKIHQLCLCNNQPLPSITIVEADGRVGGRMSTMPHKGINLDLGAHWIGPSHTNILKLCQELGLDAQLYDQHDTGQKILDLDRKQSLYTSDIPTPLGITSLIDLGCTLWDIERMAYQAYEGRAAPSFQHYLDSITIESLLKDLQAWTAVVRKMTSLLVRLTFGCEPSQCSALQFIAMIKQAQYSMDRLASIRNGYQQTAMHGGMQQIAQRLLEQLLAQNTRLRIVYNHAVYRVQQQTDDVVLYCAPRKQPQSTDNTTLNPTITAADISVCSQLDMRAVQKLSASFVVSAVPLYMNGRYIEFEPRLPLRISHLLSNCYPGTYFKGFAFFDACFWKQYGFSGEVASDGLSGPVLFFVDKDTSHMNANETQLSRHWKGRKVYCLVGLGAGSVAREWREKTRTQRQDALLQQLSTYFQQLIPAKKRNAVDLVRQHFVDYTEVFWMDCAPFDVYPPGVGYDRIGQKEWKHGRVHFASTNLGVAAFGYMEGAVSSGNEQGQIVYDRMKCGGNKESVDDETMEVRKANDFQPFQYRSVRRLIGVGLSVAALAIGCTFLARQYTKQRTTRIRR